MSSPDFPSRGQTSGRQEECDWSWVSFAEIPRARKFFLSAQFSPGSPSPHFQKEQAVKTRTLPWAMAAGWLILGAMFGLFDAFRSHQAWAADKKPKIAAGEFKLSGPYSHENLTIFLVHGQDKIVGKKFMTLQEALEQKTVIVHETSQVNELAIENVSKDVEVFVQSGDILKGGNQDRLISFSMIVPAQSGKVPVAAFCVEQGRWGQRGKEAAGRFGTSTTLLPSKALKVNGGAYAQL